ncbi:unnamed protein product [Peniophora sp. CBMAI 1063]|nr:unnamed protein product [Peniophora sp. CBMAI 1063]
MPGKLMNPALGRSNQSTNHQPAHKEQRPAAANSPEPKTSMIALLQIVVVLGLSLALGSICKIIRQPVQKDQLEAHTAQYSDLVQRCLSIVKALQSDATLPLPAKAVLHALNFIFDRLDSTSSSSAVHESRSSADDCRSDNNMATDDTHDCDLDATAKHEPRLASLSDGTDEQDAIDAQEPSDMAEVKLSKAARRRRNRKARLAPYLKPASTTSNSSVA